MERYQGFLNFPSIIHKEVLHKEKINIWTDEDIQWWASKYSHKISKKNCRMYKSGKKVDRVSQMEAVQKLDELLRGPSILCD